MEDWTAATSEPKHFSQARVEGCDLCILLVAFRRGHVPRGERLSITQLEYQTALRLDVDILVFMLEEQAPWPRKFDELEKDPEMRRWRADQLERKGVSFFSLDPKSIEVEPALTRWLAERGPKLEESSPSLPQPLLPPDTVRLKGKQTFRGYGFFTPRGYVIADRIPFEREQQLLAETPSHSEEACLKIQLVRFARSIPVALARPLGVPLRGHPMHVRPTGSLGIGDTVQLYRGPNYTTPGKVIRMSVKMDLSGAHGIETQERLLESTNISSAGDSGAPVVDGEKRVVGMLYAGSTEVSLAVPIELIMSEFPDAF
jgi:hypothetical protein